MFSYLNWDAKYCSLNKTFLFSPSIFHRMLTILLPMKLSQVYSHYENKNVISESMLCYLLHLRIILFALLSLILACAEKYLHWGKHVNQLEISFPFLLDRWCQNVLFLFMKSLNVKKFWSCAPATATDLARIILAASLSAALSGTDFKMSVSANLAVFAFL